MAHHNTDTPETAAASEKTPNLFPKIGDVVEDDELLPTVMESLCMNCYEKGTTRLLFTEIPFFRQIILMSFRCPHCGFSNNEIQPGSAVQEQGGTYTLTMDCPEDLQRRVVKSEAATFRLEELDFEIPAHKGVFTTLEGLLMSARDELEQSQPQRRLVDAPVAEQVQEFIDRLTKVIEGERFPLHVSLDDPSGNSFLENLIAPKHDPKLEYKLYNRTPEMQRALGLQVTEYELDDDEAKEREAQLDARRAEIAKNNFVVKDGGRVNREKRDDSTLMEKEVFQIPSNCPDCGTEGTSKTYCTDIPYFREVIIMAFDCPNEDCGYKTNEIKAGGAIPEMGKILRLSVLAKDEANPEEWVSDMKRDVVKSNSAGFTIPELDIEVTQGSLGGMYTTVEGLLQLAKESLFSGTARDFATGDSADDDIRERFDNLEKKFDQVLEGTLGFTLELKDPLACSFIYSPTAPEPEPRLEVMDYERSFDDNEELGLNDMNTENYEVLDGSSPAPAAAAAPVPPSKPVIDLDEGSFEGPFETFQGARDGMVFRLGAKGLGYYEDLVRTNDYSEPSVQQRMRDLQANGHKTHPNPNAVQHDS